MSFDWEKDKLPVGTRVRLIGTDAIGKVTGMSQSHDTTFVDVRWANTGDCRYYNNGGFLRENLEVESTLAPCAQCDSLKLTNDDDYLCVECRDDS